jgi:putative hemolysin
MNPLAGLALLFTFCLLLSILFTAMGSAYAEVRARAAADGSGREVPDDLFHALALGNLAADLGATAAAALGLRLLHPDQPGPGEWVALGLGLALVLLVPCEVLPRALGAAGAEATVRRWEPLLRPWLRLSRPFAAALTAAAGGVRQLVSGGIRVARLTTEEVRTAVETADDELEREERDMVHSIFSFGETTVREVMVPRPDIVAVDEDVSFEELVETAREAEHSRLPVYRGTLDNVVGIVTVKDLLARRYHLDGRTGLDGLLREPFYVPESKKIDDLLRDFQARGAHMAIVVDEYGGTAGLVTIEDVLEEIVGEIQDEHDLEEPLWAEEPDGSLLVDARLDLHDFGEIVGTRLEGEGFETVGGLVYSLLGRVPEVGEEVATGGLSFRVVALEGRRIQKLHVTRLAAGVPRGPRGGDGVEEA